jgi:hypothetical protein
LPAARHLGDHPLEDVGIGELGGEGSAYDIAGQGGERAILSGGCQVFLGEVGIDNSERPGVLRAELPEQPLARADDLGEQLLLGLEMGVERAAGQPGRQHDVVDAGAGIAAQPEQSGGMLEDLGPDAGGMAGARRHGMPISIPYVDRHDTRIDPGKTRVITSVAGVIPSVARDL